MKIMEIRIEHLLYTDEKTLEDVWETCVFSEEIGGRFFDHQAEEANFFFHMVQPEEIMISHGLGEGTHRVAMYEIIEDTKEGFKKTLLDSRVFRVERVIKWGANG